jgi:hypothetical protein
VCEEGHDLKFEDHIVTNPDLPSNEKVMFVKVPRPQPKATTEAFGRDEF